MKFHIIFTLATAALAGTTFSAKACNPMLNPNYGKHVAPTVMPPDMLARNHPANARTRTSIVGLWHVVHTASNGTLFLEGYDTWNQTGTENELGNLPPAGGNLCVGVWKKQGDKILLTAHVAWVYDLSGNYQGPLDFTETNQVSPDGNSYTGTFDAKFFDANGNLLNEVTGTTAAERLGS